LQKQDIHVDVILSDIQMPGKMNGFRFAQWARSVRPGVDIVLNRATYAAQQLCEQGPMLMKPYDHKIVLDHIKRLLAARARQAGS
jgi:two-component SAPR family response regulator